MDCDNQKKGKKKKRKKGRNYFEKERERKYRIRERERLVLFVSVCVWKKVGERGREREKLSIYTVYTLTKAHTRKSVSTLQ